MGLLDYYRQFEDMDQEEVNRGLRERSAREKAKALEQVLTVDLSSTVWPDLPNSEVINASIYAARGRVNSYPDRHASKIRRTLAERHGIDPEQIVVGNGASELLQAAAHVLLAPGEELITRWPSYPLYPLMARRASARAVPVESSEPEALLQAVTRDTRVVVICNPNDPTGDYLDADKIGRVLAELPENVHVLLDEALVHYQDVERTDAALRLVDAFPRLLVFRTYSKIYGLSGLRAGYVVGPRGRGDLLEALAPALGVNTLTQAGIEQALKLGDGEVARRREMVIAQRRRLERELHGLPVQANPSQANFLWLSMSGMNGAQLAAHLESEGVIVAPGGPLGEDEHVRVTIRGAAATERLLDGLRAAAG